MLEPSPLYNKPQTVEAATFSASQRFGYQPRRGLSIPAITVLDAAGRVIEEEQRSVFRYLAQHGDELAADITALRFADLRAKDRDTAVLEEIAAGLECERANPHRIADLAVTGDDLIELGFTPGPALGGALRTLLDAVLDDPELNTRDELLAQAQELR